jgi:predicted ATPase
MIGENGAGKSNILEALVMASAASKGNLNRELLVARGVRVSQPELMKSAYDGTNGLLEKLDFTLSHSGEPYADWQLEKMEIPKIAKSVMEMLGKLPKDIQKNEVNAAQTELTNILSELPNLGAKNLSAAQSKKLVTDALSKFSQIKSHLLSMMVANQDEKQSIERFTVYSPEYSRLRNFDGEGQTAPLGTKGEGLISLLSSMKKNEPDRLKVVSEGLKILGWFKSLDLSALNLSDAENRLQVKDKFIRQRGVFLDQTSMNEGFLFCLFYLVLFASSKTPRAFAIKNIENGLNPKLCQALMMKLKELAVAYDKQAIFSTHSPAVLDALDLNQDNDLLLAVDRTLDGHTRVQQVKKPANMTGKITRLSEAFLMGHLGGVPKNFA